MWRRLQVFEEAIVAREAIQEVDNKDEPLSVQVDSTLFGKVIEEDVEDFLFKIEKEEFKPACLYFYEIHKDFINKNS